VGKPSKPTAWSFARSRPASAGYFQVRIADVTIAEACALAFEQGRDVDEHAVRLGVEVTDVRGPAVLVDARVPEM